MDAVPEILADVEVSEEIGAFDLARVLLRAGLDLGSLGHIAVGQARQLGARGSREKEKRYHKLSLHFNF